MEILVGNIRLPVRFHPRRRRLAVVVADQGLELRAPSGCPYALIEQFAQAQACWIKRMAAVCVDRRHYLWGEPLSHTLTVVQARGELVPWLSERIAFWQPKMGIRAENIQVRRLKSRWGSCSSRGHLSFSLSLVQLPESVADYVVVHELAHLHEMNHSAAFWAQVAAVMPDFKSRRSQLRHWSRKIALL